MYTNMQQKHRKANEASLSVCSYSKEPFAVFILNFKSCPVALLVFKTNIDSQVQLNIYYNSNVHSKTFVSMCIYTVMDLI